ncbi:MAG: hypothetical protein ACPL7L_03935 [bacterium]
MASEGPGESTGSLLLKFINLAIFVAVIYKIGAKKIAEFFSNHRQKIIAIKEEAEKTETEALKAFESWEERIRKAEEDINQIIEAALLESKRLKEEILSEAQREAIVIVEQAETSIAEEIRNVKRMLGKELVLIATQKAEEQIKERINSKHQEMLVNEFLQKIEELS